MRKDILWKGIIEEVFDDLLRFIFPKANQWFDLNRKFVFLDKELAELYPEPEKSTDTRIADKLVQVYRKNGREEWLLIHFEVQGKAEKDFPARMFRYYYRILDRWRRPVTAVAIFAGKDSHLIPDCYVHRFYGTELMYKYNVLRIGTLNEEELAKDSNPFATVVLVAKKALAQKRDEDYILVQKKLDLVKALIARKDLSKRKIKVILTFINNYLVFNTPEFNKVFKTHLENLTSKSKNMGFFEVIENELRKEEREAMVGRMLKKGNFSDDQIAFFADMPVDFVVKMRNRMLARKAGKKTIKKTRKKMAA